MKAVVAGAVGADCGEADLTHCGPQGHANTSSSLDFVFGFALVHQISRDFTESIR